MRRLNFPDSGPGLIKRRTSACVISKWSRVDLSFFCWAEIKLYRLFCVYGWVRLVLRCPEAVFRWKSAKKWRKKLDACTAYVWLLNLARGNLLFYIFSGECSFSLCLWIRLCVMKNLCSISARPSKSRWEGFVLKLLCLRYCNGNIMIIFCF